MGGIASGLGPGGGGWGGSSGWHGGGFSNGVDPKIYLGLGLFREYYFEGPNCTGLKFGFITEDIRDYIYFDRLQKEIKKLGIVLPTPKLTKDVVKEEASRQIPFMILESALDYVMGNFDTEFGSEQIYISDLSEARQLDETIYPPFKSLELIAEGLLQSRYLETFGVQDAMQVLGSALNIQEPIFMDKYVGRALAEDLNFLLTFGQGYKSRELRHEIAQDAFKVIKKYFSEERDYLIYPTIAAKTSVGAEFYATMQYAERHVTASIGKSGDLIISEVHKSILGDNINYINLYPSDGIFAGKRSGSLTNPITGADDGQMARLIDFENTVRSFPDSEQYIFFDKIYAMDYVRGAVPR
ncbi:MAG: hypothetical protein NDI94_05740 [Candidatus Woesearchaeota archaeon]|nr:hypothetical protein [Candidatus Woesearchaeota archaeon]